MWRSDTGEDVYPLCDTLWVDGEEFLLRGENVTHIDALMFTNLADDEYVSVVNGVFWDSEGGRCDRTACTQTSVAPRCTWVCAGVERETLCLPNGVSTAFAIAWDDSDTGGELVQAYPTVWTTYLRPL